MKKNVSNVTAAAVIAAAVLIPIIFVSCKPKDQPEAAPPVIEEPVEQPAVQSEQAEQTELIEQTEQTVQVEDLPAEEPAAEAEVQEMQDEAEEPPVAAEPPVVEEAEEAEEVIQEAKPEPEPEAEVVEEPPADTRVRTFVNTGVNISTGEISTVLVFQEIIEVTAISPNKERTQYPLSESSFVYDKNTTELKVTLPESIPHKAEELTYHIEGIAAEPAAFVLSDIDLSQGAPAVFIKGKKAVAGKDYSYNKKTNCLTSLVPLNVDADSFQICWAKKNGTLNFSNNLNQYKNNYTKLRNEWQNSLKK